MKGHAKTLILLLWSLMTVFYQVNVSPLIITEEQQKLPGLKVARLLVVTINISVWLDLYWKHKIIGIDENSFPNLGLILLILFRKLMV